MSDTGVGIPKHVQPKLFTMYGTFDHNRGLNRHGIGLGLTIMRKLVRQLGPQRQKICLDSEPGRGTRITFLVYQDVEKAQKKDEKSARLPAINLGGVRPQMAV